MTYLNPFQFIEPPLKSLEEFEPSMIKKAKQRLLAEFELSEDGLLQWDGRTLDKSSTLAALESLFEPEQCAAHWEIWQNQPLRNFLSNPEIITLFLLTSSQLQLSPTAMGFVSEDLFRDFERLSRAAFEQRQSAAIANILNKAKGMPGQALERLCKPIEEELNIEMEKMFKVYHQLEEDEDVDAGELYGFSMPFWPEVLNALPFLYQLRRNEFTKLLAEIGWSQRLGDPNDIIGRRIMENALRVDADPELLTDIRQNIKASLKKESPRPKPGKNSGVGIGIGFIVLIYFLIQLGNSMRPSKKEPDHYAFSPKFDLSHLGQGSSLEQLESQRKQTQEMEYRQLMDSLYKAAQNPLPKHRKRHLMRLPTGTEVYEAFYSSIDSPRDAQLLELHNKGKKDLVVFLENGNSLLEQAFYIQAGDYWEVLRSSSNGFVLLAYDGSQWQDSLCSIYTAKEGYINVPGFANSTQYIGRNSLKEGPYPQWVSSFFPDSQKELRIEFDGNEFIDKRPVSSQKTILP